MNVLMVEPGIAPYEKEINGLEEMQTAVGGLITTSYPYEEPVAIVSNDESMTDQTPNEEYTYHVGNINFVVTPIYKENGEPMRDILLKLMLAEVSPA